MTLGADLPERRTQGAVSAAYGTGTVYGRVYVAQNAKDANDLIATGGDLALATALPNAWYPDGVTAPTATLATAKLQSAVVQFERTAQTLRHVVQCQFIAFNIIGSVSAGGYATLTAYREVSEDQVATVYEGWGIAAATTSADIPAIGAVAAGSGITAVRLFEQSLDDKSYPGRVIVRNLYRALKAGAITAGYKATPLLET